MPAIAKDTRATGKGMFMVGSVKDNVFGRLMKQPDEIGDAETGRADRQVRQTRANQAVG